MTQLTVNVRLNKTEIVKIAAQLMKIWLFKAMHPWRDRVFKWWCWSPLLWNSEVDSDEAYGSVAATSSSNAVPSTSRLLGSVVATRLSTSAPSTSRLPGTVKPPVHQRQS
ncbi:hypothetical protein DPMN_106078 [Dreissena polymorpha]|uniref:Uncharacterized protein n=1 Tax=Dreissena polymorpha TaxID=45954 RepID=A0A9D4QI30_DREPO|nr:hypothetical protein DPMN_106078 [Dreissena polymorpha]